jgi:unsaturated rhamnogalacturonyl hydrolase
LSQPLCGIWEIVERPKLGIFSIDDDIRHLPLPFNRIVQEFGLCVHLQRMLPTAILTPMYRNPLAGMLPSSRWAWDTHGPMKRPHSARKWSVTIDNRKYATMEAGVRRLGNGFADLVCLASRNHYLKMFALCLLLLTGVASAANRVHGSRTQDLRGRDLSKMVVHSTMARYPSAGEFGEWAYFRSLYLMGQYTVYKRTGDKRYLDYIREWVDSHVDAKGNIDHEISGLDYVQPGNLLLLMYSETGEQKYRVAATQIRTRINNYPRTEDGGFWHSSTEDYKKHELWLDGTYMSLPFLLRYARAFGGERVAYDEAAKQLLLDYEHTHSETNGLLYHAYDERGAAVWAKNPRHHSPIFWARAIGWYGMALVDTLDVLPADHPQRAALIQIVQRLVASLVEYQDPETGLWFQVVDQPKLKGNWRETSSSCMFTYIVDVAVRRGYVDRKYHSGAERGYNGVLSQMTVDGKGLVDIHNICEGTDVGDVAFYLNRRRETNDPHGLGAFLIMNEEWTTGNAAMRYPAAGKSVAVKGRSGW